MQTEIERLEAENTKLQSQVNWLRNVASKMLVMIGNVGPVLEEYEKHLTLIQVELGKTKTIYSDLEKNIREALSEIPTGTDT